MAHRVLGGERRVARALFGAVGHVVMLAPFARGALDAGGAFLTCAATLPAATNNASRRAATAFFVIAWCMGLSPFHLKLSIRVTRIAIDCLP